MRRFIETTIAKLKNDPGYKLDESFSFRQLMTIVHYRFWQTVRGFFLKFKIHSKGLIFCGRRVIVQHGYLLHSGKSLILEDGVHISALSRDGIILGDNVTIGKFAILSCTGVIANKGVGIRIGNNSAVGAQSFLGGQGGISIGNDVIMGPQVKIFSENHVHENPEVPIRKQGESRKGVIIEDNCWIGGGVVILDGVTVGMGSIVAAGAVVTENVPAYSLSAGVPAKVIKKRK